MELRSPDPAANPYLAFALMIYAGLEGIKKKLPLGDAADINLYKADLKTLSNFEKLPENYQEACAAAFENAFIKTHIPSDILDIYGRA